MALASVTLCNTLCNEKLQLSSQVAHLEERCATLVKDIDYVEIRCDELEGLNTDLEKDCKKLFEQYVELDKLCDQLTLELSESRKAYNLLSRCEVSGKTTLEFNEACEELDKLSKELSDSQETCKRLEADCDQYSVFLDSWRENAANLTLELSKTKELLANANEYLESDRRQIEYQRKSIECLVNTLERDAVLAKENVEVMEKEKNYLHTLLDKATITNEHLSIQCNELKKHLTTSLQDKQNVIDDLSDHLNKELARY
jgi:chromosome segregation ATPase